MLSLLGKLELWVIELESKVLTLGIGSCCYDKLGRVEKPIYDSLLFSKHEICKVKVLKLICKVEKLFSLFLRIFRLNRVLTIILLVRYAP